MPIAEGNTVSPRDANGLSLVGTYDGTNLWLPRSDAAHNLKVALYDASGNPLLVAGATPGSFQDTGVTTTAAAFASHPCIKAAFQADAANSDDVFIGVSGGQTWRLVPTSAIVVPCTNTNLYYRRSASGTQTINVIFLN